MEWIKAPADTMVCEEKNVMLKDVVQIILDGAETPEEIMLELDLSDADLGTEQIPEIASIFVPVVNAWKAGTCAGGCSGCNGGCCVE